MMTRISAFLRDRFAYFGMAGSLLLSACIAFSAITYSGRAGERYSLLNHFISELGEVGVSPNAWLFNLGIFLAGLLFLVFCVGLGLAIPNTWAKLGLAAGAGAAIACSLVGVFPMNRLDPHITVALTYFRLGLVTVLLFGIAILRQPAGQRRVRAWANLASLAAVLCYAVFLLYRPEQGSAAAAGGLDTSLFGAHRPSVWPLAVLEWLVFFSTVAWFFAIGLAVRPAAASQPVVSLKSSQEA